MSGVSNATWAACLYYDYSVLTLLLTSYPYLLYSFYRNELEQNYGLLCADYQQ
jgi:hypothetical protein